MSANARSAHLAAVSAVERLERGAAVLKLGARVAARGLHVGVAEHVGDERQIAPLVADQPGRDRVPQPVSGLSSTPAAAITFVTSLVIERTESCSPVREIHSGPRSPAGAFGWSWRLVSHVRSAARAERL